MSPSPCSSIGAVPSQVGDREWGSPNESCSFFFGSVIENHHGEDGEEYAVEYPDYGEGCLLQCDCSAECYREDSSHREYRFVWILGTHPGTQRPGTCPFFFPNPVCCRPQAEKTLEQLHLSSTQEEKKEEIRSPPEPVSPWLLLHCPLSLEGSSPPSSAFSQPLEGNLEGSTSLNVQP